MIAANGVTARFQSARNVPSLRRVERSPRRWSRIVAIAAEAGCILPETADAKVLEAFLLQRRAAETLRFGELSLAAGPCPFTLEELDALARHYTLEEDAAAKVERTVAKAAADKGTWARILPFHIEGRLVEGFQGLDVGAPVRAQLVKVDVERGFIDLKVVPSN